MTPIVLETPPGPRTFCHLVLDFTGTLALDGSLLPGVSDRLQQLAEDLQITILTADTFGTAVDALGSLPVEVRVIGDGAEKARIMAALSPDQVIAIGNGRNDIPMMEVAGLAIAVVGPEGAAAELLPSANILTRDINDALDLVLHPLRLKATLRD
jgi:soluble P-type ATPase